MNWNDPEVRARVAPYMEEHPEAFFTGLFSGSEPFTDETMSKASDALAIPVDVLRTIEAAVRR